jgi:hypothetical protein
VVTLQHIRTKKIITKSNDKAELILNNKVTGHEWKVLKATKVVAPAEVVKVSISEKTQDKDEKPNKQNNANRKRNP